MVISQISLKSFRSFVDVEVPTDAPRILIAGLNEIGKTTLGREAIRYVLLGEADVLNGRGSGQDMLVPAFNGSSTVSASLTIQGIGTVERTWAPSGSSLRVQGFTGDPSAQQAALLDKLHTTAPFLRACLDSKVFLRLDHKDAKALVLALLNVQIQLGTDPKEVYGLSEIDEMYARAFEDRKDAKRLLARHVLPPQPSQEPHGKVAEIDTKLAERRRQLETVLGQAGEVSGQRETLERRKRNLLSQTPVVIDPKDVADLVSKIEEVEERLGIMDETPAEEPARPAQDDPEPGIGTEGRLVFLRGRIEALKAHKPKEGCVLDDSIPCPVAKQKFTYVAKEYEAELQAQEAEAPAAVPEPVTSVTATNPKDALRRQLTALRKALETSQIAIEREEQRQASLRVVETELAELPDTSTRDAEIADLRERIQKGERLRLAAEQHWRAIELFDRELEIHKTLTADVDRLEELCAVLGPNGVRVQALGSAIERFEAAVNEFTKPYGWTVKFELDPWAVRVNDRRVETYSKSQRYRIGIAIQLAVAMLSGLKFAVVDEMDILTEQNRNLMAGMLLNSPLDQIIMLGSRELSQKLPVLPQLPGLLVAYRLHMEDGRSRVVERMTV